MECRSDRVNRVSSLSMAAQQRLERARYLLRDAAAGMQSQFLQKIESSLMAAGVKDARELLCNSLIKMEYVNELGGENINAAVRSVLNQVTRLKDPHVAMPESNDDAISVYADAVNTVVEAAKFAASSVSGLTFLALHPASGLHVFVMAASTGVKDLDTFGGEAVAATMIFYRVMENTQDVEKDMAKCTAVIDTVNLGNMKALHAALTEDLASGEIDISDWTARSQAYAQVIGRIERRRRSH